MGRFTAILMLALLGAFYAVPLVHAVSSDPESDLPACCRTHGKHHCALSMRVVSQLVDARSGEHAIAAPATCPSFPDYAVTTTTAPQALTGSPVNLPALLAHPHSPIARRAIARLSQIRTRAGRGPPASSLV
jgi:hypothetical protein